MPLTEGQGSRNRSCKNQYPSCHPQPIVSEDALRSYLIQLQAHKPGDQRRCGRNSRHDLPSDELRFVLVRCLNPVIPCSKVACSGNKFDMRIKVLFKFNWSKTISSQT